MLKLIFLHNSVLKKNKRERLLKIRKDENIEIEKTKIIKAAYDCFLKKGYAATSVDDIVREYGKSKGNVYYYFKNKEEICLELWRRWHIEHIVLVKKLSEKNKEVKKFLMEFIDGFFEYSKIHRHYFRIKFEFSSISIFNEKYQKMIDEFCEKWMDIFLVYKTQFKEPEKYISFIKLFLSVIDGLIFRYTVQENFELDEQFKIEFRKMINLYLKENLKK